MMRQLILGNTARPKIFCPYWSIFLSNIWDLHTRFYATIIDPDETSHFEESQRDLIICTYRLLL